MLHHRRAILNKEHNATEVRDITRSREASTKSLCFDEHEACFIDLAHRSDSGCSEVSQCIRVYSTCRQCRNATVALANNSGLPGHHRLVVETVSASTTPCCW